VFGWHARSRSGRAVLARLCVTCESDGGGAEIRICNVRTAASVVLVWTPSERWCWCWGVVIAGKAGWLHALVQPTEAGLVTLPNPRGRPCGPHRSCRWSRVGLGGPPPSAQGSLSCSVQRGGLAACDSTPAIFRHRTTSRGPPQCVGLKPCSPHT
jgi:hypothetical protein